MFACIVGRGEATSLFIGLINHGAADCTIWLIACSEAPLSALLLLGTNTSKCLIHEIADGYINTLISRICLLVRDYGLLARRSPHNTEQGFITMQISHSATDSEPITTHSDMVICAVTVINRPISDWRKQNAHFEIQMWKSALILQINKSACAKLIGNCFGRGGCYITKHTHTHQS